MHVINEIFMSFKSAAKYCYIVIKLNYYIISDNKVFEYTQKSISLTQVIKFTIKSVLS